MSAKRTDPDETKSDRRSAGPWHRAVVTGIGLLLIVMSTRPALAVTHLKYGMDAPAIELSTLDGKEIKTRGMNGSVLILVFGEVYHDKTLQACQQISTILQEDRFRKQQIVPILIVAQDADADQIAALTRDKPLPRTILLDVNRTAYDTYRVAVMPSVVVVDDKGKVVHAIAAYTTQFGDVLTDSLLLALGQIDIEAFDLRLHPQATTTPDTEQMRAQRLTSLAGQLLQRGLDDMAAEKYAEALSLEPDSAAAHLGMGKLQLKRRRLAEAEDHFQKVLDHDAGSAEASLGLAFVQTLRGGDELGPAERLVRQVIAQSPSQPRAYYLLGLIQEQREQTKEAAASFKKAAELLMERNEQEPSP